MVKNLGRKAAIGLTLSVALAVGGTTIAYADDLVVLGGRTCSNAFQTVKISSNATARVWHYVGDTVRAEWNNGSSYIWRQNNTNQRSVPSTYVLSSVDVYSASAFC